MNYGIIKTIFVLLLFTGIEILSGWGFLLPLNDEKDVSGWVMYYAMINTIIVYAGLLYLCMKHF